MHGHHGEAESAEARTLAALRKHERAHQSQEAGGVCGSGHQQCDGGQACEQYEIAPQSHQFASVDQAEQVQGEPGRDRDARRHGAKWQQQHRRVRRISETVHISPWLRDAQQRNDDQTGASHDQAVSLRPNRYHDRTR
jgi:hypothetical protein